MNNSLFDVLARSFAGPSRRSLFTAVASAIGAALFGDDGFDETLAKRKKKRKRQKKPRPASPPPQTAPPPPRCGVGQKPCGTGCIPTERCCTDADCPNNPDDPCVVYLCDSSDPADPRADARGCIFTRLPWPTSCSPGGKVCDGHFGCICFPGFCGTECPCSSNAEICRQGSCECDDRCDDFGCQCYNGKVCTNGQCQCDTSVRCGWFCPCSGGKVCTDGMDGRCVCPSGQHECNGACVSDDDVQHCGTRCDPCPDCRANERRECLQGVCRCTL